jgi:hypothetical protein
MLPNQFDRLFGFCGTNRFSGGFMGGMTFLSTEVIAATGRASYQVEHRTADATCHVHLHHQTAEARTEAWGESASSDWCLELLIG